MHPRNAMWPLRSHAVRVLVVLCAALALTPYAGTAATYYIAPAGNDSRSCATAQGISTPKASISSGIACLSAGDTLYLRAGTYTEAIDSASIVLPSGTSWGNAITIAGYPNESVTLSRGINIQTNADFSVVSYLIFSNLILRNPNGNAYRLDGGSHHIRLMNSDAQSGLTNTVFIGNPTSYNEVLNCTVHDSPVEYVPAWGTTTGTYGFYIGGNHMLIEGNTIYNNTGYAISLYSSGSSNVSDNILRNNTMYGNGFDDGLRGLANGAVVIASGSNNLFYNNVVYGNTIGISIGYSEPNNYVYNNTVYGNRDEGISILPSAPGTIIRNNITYNNGTNITDWGATGTVRSNNLEANPLFVNAAAGDFTLQAGSPAIDAGTTLGSVPTDKNGVARPQGAAYDIGAYEFGGGTPIPIPIPIPSPRNLRRATQ